MNTIKKQATVNKLPAAPASFSVSAVTSGVVGEPDDAGFGRLTVGLCFCFMQISLELSIAVRNEAISLLYRAGIWMQGPVRETLRELKIK
jgi:hypothetical protein